MRVLVLVLLVGCVSPPVYRVQRTARVPHPAAPLRTGEPIDGVAELSFGSSSIGDSRRPRLMDHDAAVEVPDQQYRGELRIRIRRGEIAPLYEYASGRRMQPLDATQAPVGKGNAQGRGMAIRYSIDAQGVTGLSFGLGLELISWAIPYVEYRTCVENCEVNDAPQMQVMHGNDSVASANFAFTPTYRRGPLALFAGAYAQRHPTIVRKASESYVEQSGDYDSDVDAGRYNWLVHAGVEYRFPVVSLLVHVQQDLTRDPVWYGPSVGFALAARLPELKSAKRPQAGDAQPW